MLTAYATSHTGLVRQGNEDAFLCSEALGLFAVADGMGGHQAGEVASRLALEAVEDVVRGSREAVHGGLPDGDLPLPPLAGRLRAAVLVANREVLRAAAERDEYSGMGTTITAALVSGGRLAWAHVGDSRLYLLAGGELRQLTRDDSWVATVLANEPGMSPEALARHPMRHVLTNVLGAREDVDVQAGELALEGEQLFLLSSDGLHGLVDDEALWRILGAGGELGDLGRRLLDAALERGGHDNVTAVLVRRQDER